MHPSHAIGPAGIRRACAPRGLIALMLFAAIPSPALARAEGVGDPGASPAPARPEGVGEPDPSSPAPARAEGRDDRSTAPATPTRGEPGPGDLADFEAALQADRRAADRGPDVAAVPRVPRASPLINPDLSVFADVAAGWFSSDGPLQPGGHDPARTGFTLQQVELSVGASVDPYFRLAAVMVFFEEGVEIEEAFATTLALPGNLQARAGQFLTRFGRQNPTHIHAWDFVDQSFALVRLFGAEGNRGLGAELAWLAPLPWYLELIGSVTDAEGEGTARSFLGEEDRVVSRPGDLQTTAALRQFFPLTDDWSFQAGLSAAGGPNPTGAGTRTAVYGGDLFLKWRPVGEASVQSVGLQGEAFWRRRATPEGLLQDFSAYGQLSWRFARRFGVAARHEWGGPARTEGVVAADWLDPDWTRDRHRASAALTFWPSEFSRLRLQGGLDRPLWLPDPIWSVVLALEVSAGAHAAHPF